VSCPVQAHVSRIVSFVNVYRATILRPRYRSPVATAAIPARSSSFRHEPHRLIALGISSKSEARRPLLPRASVLKSPCPPLQRKETP